MYKLSKEEENFTENLDRNKKVTVTEMVLKIYSGNWTFHWWPYLENLQER